MTGRLQSRLRLLTWKARYWWLDTPAGRVACLVIAVLCLLGAAWRGLALYQLPTDAPQQAAVNIWIQIVWFIVSTLIVMALAPRPKDVQAAPAEAPQVEDGAALPVVFGEDWIDSPVIAGWKQRGTKNIRGKKSGFSSRPIIGYWYDQLFLFVLARDADALLEFRAGDKVAWSGVKSDPVGLGINKRDLWGGDKTGGEGGVDGQLQLLLGGQEQPVQLVLAGELGGPAPAYRGAVTALWRGLWGAFTPYPKRAAFKLRRILSGWDGEVWYPEKAVVPLLNSAVQMHGPGWEYIIETFAEPNTAWADWAIPADGWQQGGELPFETGWRVWNPKRSNIWIRRTITALVPGLTLRIGADNGCVVFVDGSYFGGSNESNANVSNNQLYPIEIPLTAGRTFTVHAKGFAEQRLADDGGNVIDLQFAGLIPTAMNPSHMLYQSITDPMMGGEPTGSIDDDSFRAAADLFYSEGLGLCTLWSPATESVEQFQQRICNVAGCSLSRSPVTGKWNVDPIRGGYDLATLPVLTDDDIITYREQPTTLDDAVNQIVVEWKDRGRKEKRSTAPVRSLGAIQNAGAVISETVSYPEVPSEGLALRLAARDLQSRAPGRRLSLTVVPDVAKTWRPGQVVHLMSPRRGIASMALRLGDVDRGTLRSGAIKLEVLQDVFSLPQTVYVPPSENLPEPPSSQASPILAGALIERPYAQLAAALTPADLAALQPGDGYVLSVATPGGAEIGYTLNTDAGAGYEAQDTGSWSATAIAAAATRLQTVVPVTAMRGWDDVPAGALVLWGSELCRLDAIDTGAGTVTLGRGCVDTAPRSHGAGERLFVIDDDAAADPERYSSGTDISAKLTPYTGSDALPLSAATALELTLANRAARPYPPGRLRVDGLAEPVQCIATITVAWVHRHRLQQAGQLVEHEASGIGPEPDTTYTVRTYIANALADEQNGITGTTATVTPTAGGACRVEVWAVRAGLESWQCAFAEFDFRLTPWVPYADQDGTTYVDQGGTNYEG